jgi:hypothetical protein
MQASQPLFDLPSKTEQKHPLVPLSCLLNPLENVRSVGSSQSNAQCPDDANANLISSPHMPHGRSRFLFINHHATSQTSQTRRANQKAIRAHAQRETHRRQRVAAILGLQRNVRVSMDSSHAEQLRQIVVSKYHPGNFDLSSGSSAQRVLFS